jgi:vancomycin permeability regulator SanA
LKIFLKRLIFGLLIAYIFAICGLLLDGAASGLYAADYAVVLGNQVLISGRPSKRLAARLDKAIELYNNNKVLAIIVSGGFGKEGFNEAIVMKTYLTQHQIPVVSKIINDSNGNNTYLTAENTKKLIGTNASIIIVSQLYHLARCKVAFKQVGFKNIGTAYPVYFEWRDLFSINRELIAMIYYYFKY